ncbi:MAG: glutamine synthetase family protein [Pseudomonadota bacterium]
MAARDGVDKDERGTIGMNIADAIGVLERNKSISTIKPVVFDLNGVARGKRLPVSQAKKALGGGLKLPLSTMFLDIWGRDVVGSGQVLETGDGDGALRPTERGLLPATWKDNREALLPLSMFHEDGTPYAADPRHALASVVARYREKKLTPVCATELEFYFYDPMTNTPEASGAMKPPLAPDGRRQLKTNALYTLDDLERFDGLFDDIYTACAAWDIPADSAISENGCGQFEINLRHGPDALRVADDAQLFKYVVKAVARRHNLAATFMAKPYGEESGSGFHTHVSILNEEGENIFANGAPEGADALRYAVGGLINAMAPSMLVFAPHANSYRRLRDGSHAPINASWGYDNRTAAVRIPSGPDAARRLEHRVAGADANPHLVLCAVLGAMLTGLTAGADPGAPISDNAYASASTRLPAHWREAIVLFKSNETTRDIFGDFLVDVFAACKEQELASFEAIVPTAEHDAYRDAV